MSRGFSDRLWSLLTGHVAAAAAIPASADAQSDGSASAHQKDALFATVIEPRRLECRVLLSRSQVGIQA
jgi:hypothetical protein